MSVVAVVGLVLSMVLRVTPEAGVMTAKLQASVDALAAQGGGTLCLTAGTYHSGALFFKPGVNLRVENDAVLLGTDDAADYPMCETRIEGETCVYYPALVNADGCDGFTISGAGVIDGHGLPTWNAFWAARAANPKCLNKEPGLVRPRLLYVSNAKGTDISGVTFRNAKFWTTHFYRCADVLVHDCTIIAETIDGVRGPSTDAIDIDACRCFTVRNVTMDVNDDAVVIKGGKGPWSDDPSRCPGNGASTDVLVENCRFLQSCHSCLTFGSECFAASHVTMRGCTVEGSGNLVNFKLRSDTPQRFADVKVEDCRGTCTHFFHSQGWSQFADLRDRGDVPPSVVDGLTMRGNTISCKTRFCHDPTVAFAAWRNCDFSGNDVRAEQEGCVPAAPWKLSANGRIDPVGVAPEGLRLGWKLPVGLKRQTAYEIEADGVACGRVASDDNVSAVWTGGRLGTGERHAWRVRLWDENGAETPWSSPATLTAARRADEPWTAKWIGPAARTRPDEDFGEAQWITAPPATNGVTTLVFAFDFDGPPGAVDFAFASVASHRITVNGKRFVRWDGFVNDWRYARFLDLAPMLAKGRNEIRVEVAADDGDTPGEPLPHIRHHGCARGIRAFIAKITLPDGRRLLTDAAAWVSPDGRVTALGSLRETDFGRETIVRQETASPAFEKTFSVVKPVKGAVLHVTGVGFYEMYLNGVKVGKKVLDPAPTAYDKRVLYSTYRLDGDLRQGENTLKLLVGHGWYDVRAVAVWNWDTAPWRDFPRTIAELRVDYADGTHETIVTDGTWRQVASPVGYDDIREGEVVGCAGSAAPDFAAETIRAEEVSAPQGVLTPEEMPGAEVMRRFVAKSVRSLGNGRYLIEFPQDVSGWMRLKLRGQEKGDVVVIRYDERDTTAPDGRRLIDMHFRRTASHRIVAEGAAFQTDRYVASGAAEETYEPRFTYNGFRFVTVEGLRRAPHPGDAEACFVHTAFETIGSFRCSDETFSKLMAMADCSYRCNYADGYPTDCPHREKNGWTGDANVASELAQYVYENTAGYEKWIGDLLDAQLPDGNLPGIVPTCGWGYHWGNGPYWDAALTVVPWNLWLYRGDRRVLESAYPAMRRYLAYTARRKNAHGLIEHGLGDWIATEPKHMPSVELTSSCSYLQALRIASETAAALGRTEDARTYGAAATALREAIRARFVREDGIVENGGQTAQAVALAYGLADPAETAAVRQRLVEAVNRTDVRLDCGLIGMKHLFRQLSEAGRTDLAFKLLTREGHPSPVEWMRCGGSALWEDWEDGNSRNHIMFGDFAAWAYQYLAGIRLQPHEGHCAAVPLSAPGFREILLEPMPIATLDWVEARTETPQGCVASGWRRTEAGIDFRFEIPGGTRAEVRLPDGMLRRVGPGAYRFVTKKR